MSFRLKIVLGVALIEAVLLFILIISSLNYLRSSNEQELLKRAYITAKLFASTAKDAVLATDLASLESFVKEVVSNPGIVYARVRSDTGIVLALGGDPDALSHSFIANKTLEDTTDGVFNAYSDIVVEDVMYGRVEIGVSVDTLKEVLAESRRHGLAIAAVGMVLVVLFSFILGSYLTRELNTLRAATRRIAQGDLDYRITVRGKDELAETAAAFNEMSQKLQVASADRQRAGQEILKLNRDLEERVLQRTQELATTNVQLEHQALHDSLTMLPNRALYHDRLEHLIALGRRAKTPFAVAIIDLDHFKEINDVKGHQTGDMVLQTMAQRLTKALRQSDTVARMGGDEFALLLPPVGDEATARMTAERIIGAMCTPMEIAGETLDVGASLGMALFPQHGEQAELLMRRADTAMYQAKFTKSGFCLYRAELEQLSQERHALQGELRRAIEEQELVLHYQPKVDFETNRLNGVEALVRWQHPKHGLMFPDQFIPMAEKTGLIKHLTTTVMRMALRQCVEWRRNGVILNMAVNIASQNLMEDDFPKRVGEILSETQAHPSWLELEITETGVMTNPVLAAETIRQLSTMGIQISIDDFGTGYSSMAYIAKLLVAKIKIDKSFVMDMTKNSTDAVIVRAAIDLGHNLGLKVVAEGVEDQATWEQLKALGCDVAQGYHLTRPVAADQLIEWIRKSPWSLEEGGGHKEEKPVATI